MPYYYSFGNADERSKRLVWNKGTVVPGYDPHTWRKDSCGHWMQYSDHGNTNSQYGWEIDHIRPVSKGGTNELSNLQPLYWENNRRKGETYPWYCENAA